MCDYGRRDHITDSEPFDSRSQSPVALGPHPLCTCHAERIANLESVLEEVREQAAYGFTGQTLENMTHPMSLRDLNAWWMNQLNQILEGKS